MAYNLIPWAIAALVAGTAAQVSANNDKKKAANTALRSFSASQKRLKDEASQLFEKRLDEQDADKQLKKVDDAAAEKVARVDDLVAKEAPNYDPMLPGSERAPKVVQEANAQSLSDSLAKARARLGAVATLEGFGSRTFDRKLDFAADTGVLGNLGLFSRGQRDVLDAQLLAAQQKSGGKAMLGDVLTALGGFMLGGATGSAVGGAASGSAGSGAQFSQGSSFPYELFG